MIEPDHTRRSAAERREDILSVALGHFAKAGYRGVSTQRIACDAGISQPYLFQLFASKLELFLASCDRAYDEIAELLRDAAANAPERERLAAMGRAYAAQVRAGRPAMLMPLQAVAASWEPDIGAHVRARVADLVKEVARTSAATPAELRAFFATAMLLNVTAALEAPPTTITRVARRRVMGPPEPWWRGEETG
jgi:AcrR family transcriptional regulator